MSRFCPAYPKPLRSKSSRLWTFFTAQRSWLDNLYERSYRMKMGEVRLARHKLFMINEPALVRRTLVDRAADYPKHRLLGEALEPLLGHSIFTTNGRQWQRQREMMNPAFAQARLNVAFPAMLQAARAMVARLDAVADGKPVDVEIEMTHVTADIIFRTILSQPLEGDDARRIFSAFSRFQSVAPKISLPLLYGLKWLVPFWRVRQGNRAAREIRGLLAKLIRPRFDAHRAGCPDARQDILGALLDARDPDSGEPMPFEELLDEVAMLFLAGHETSASALTWSLHLLAHSPDIQQRLHDEARAVFGDQPPQAGHLRELEFTRQVFRETLRLFPPVGFFAREATVDDSMRDKSIHPGDAVMISPWLIHRHRELWERPDEFDPDRYQTPAAQESSKCAYLPFGMGPRVCIGATFAQQEATLLLAMLAQRYRLQPVAGHEPRPVGRLTIRAANGVLLQVHRRATENSPT